MLQLQTNLEQQLANKQSQKHQLVLLSADSHSADGMQTLKFRKQDGIRSESSQSISEIVTTGPAPSDDEWILVSSRPQSRNENNIVN